MDNNKTILTEGTLLQEGKYRIDGFLANGGFGNTYIASNVKLNNKLVIKEFFLLGISTRNAQSQSVTITVDSNQSIWEKQKKKFLHEAQRISRLNHQGVVRVIDLFEENNTVYYAMDYIDGQTLSQLVKEHGPLSEAVTIDYYNQLLDALDEVHRNNILHLDIKPSNIMVNNNGKVTLIDFGASKQIQFDDNNMTTTTGLAYTPAYAPPELQFGKSEKIGPWSDLYSLGATLYYLLTGQTPPDAMELMSESVLDENGTLSQKMRDLINKLMNPHIDKRAQSVSELKGLIANNKPIQENLEVQPSTEPHTAPSTDMNISEATIAKQKVEEQVTDVRSQKPSLLMRVLALVLMTATWLILYNNYYFTDDSGFQRPIVMWILVLAAVCVLIGVIMHSTRSQDKLMPYEYKLPTSLIDIGYVVIAGFFLFAALNSFLALEEEGFHISIVNLIIDAFLSVASGYSLYQGLSKPKRAKYLWMGLACLAILVIHLMMRTNIAQNTWYYRWYYPNFDY